MISVRNNLTGKINSKVNLKGKINTTIKGTSEPIIIYPTIKDLEVIPTKQEQVFKHENSYGYDNVTIKPIPDEYIIPNGTKEITTNGYHQVTEYKGVNVDVNITPKLQDKEITPTKEIQNITSDNGYDGLNKVKVNPIPDNYIIPSGTLEITDNGVTDVTSYAKVNVKIETTTPEDLTEELNTYNTELTEQEILINRIIEALNNRK